jgi:hypothetical protein
LTSQFVVLRLFSIWHIPLRLLRACYVILWHLGWTLVEFWHFTIRRLLNFVLYIDNT